MLSNKKYHIQTAREISLAVNCYDIFIFIGQQYIFFSAKKSFGSIRHAQPMLMFILKNCSEMRLLKKSNQTDKSQLFLAEN